jgi:hypothetical protein
MITSSVEVRSGMASTSSDVGVGYTIFAATMMVVLGLFDAFQGLAAVIRKNYFVVTGDYVYKLNATTWGWIHLILGIVVVMAGVAVLRGAVWARVVGVIVAGVIAISNFLWLPYYPLWSIVIIATCGLVIWALAWHGRDVAA